MADVDDDESAEAQWPDLFVALTPDQRQHVLRKVATEQDAGWVETRDHLILRIDRLLGLKDDAYLHRLAALSGRRRLTTKPSR